MEESVGGWRVLRVQVGMDGVGEVKIPTGRNHPPTPPTHTIQHWPLRPHAAAARRALPPPCLRAKGNEKSPPSFPPPPTHPPNHPPLPIQFLLLCRQPHHLGGARQGRLRPPAPRRHAAAGARGARGLWRERPAVEVRRDAGGKWGGWVGRKGKGLALVKSFHPLIPIHPLVVLLPCMHIHRRLRNATTTRPRPLSMGT